MAPVVFGISPMMERIVVVLPAPLRPTRATTSPCATEIDTPCSVWLAPYQALRSLVSSIAIVLSQIDATDLGVRLDVIRRAVGDQPPVMQHQDAVAEAENHLHLVFDQEDGALRCQLLQQRHHLL